MLRFILMKNFHMTQFCTTLKGLSNKMKKSYFLKFVKKTGNVSLRQQEVYNFFSLYKLACSFLCSLQAVDISWSWKRKAESKKFSFVCTVSSFHGANRLDVAARALPYSSSPFFWRKKMKTVSRDSCQTRIIRQRMVVVLVSNSMGGGGRRRRRRGKKSS